MKRSRKFGRLLSLVLAVVMLIPLTGPMTVSLLCPVRNGSKARSFTKKFWNDRIGSWNGNRRFFPIREIVLLFIR